MNIVVLIKQVPDTYSERRLTSNGVLDRDADAVLDEIDAVLDEINERAVEAALQLKETGAGTGGASEVTVLTMGPDRATDAIRKALAMGADRAVHLCDPALAGADAVGTARALTRAIGTIDGVDLVIAGNEASDGRGGAMAAMVADLLGVPALTHAREITIDGPDVVKKKPVSTITLTDTGPGTSDVDLPKALTRVIAVSAKPPKSAGEKVEDSGDGDVQIAAFLAAQKLI